VFEEKIEKCTSIWYNHLQKGGDIMAEIRGRGRKGDQKMKPYLVYDYLMKNSDENHVVSANEICGYLEEMGISAERRSI
jgi:hypothetical protein